MSKIRLRRRSTHRLVRRRQQRPGKARRGATLVEFAIVAQVLFLLVLACVEFCRLNMIKNLTQDAAYYAARQCMVPGATVAEAKAEANRILSAMGTRGADVKINGNDTLDNDSEQISVRIIVPIDDNAFLIPTFSSSMNYSATATMKTERYDGYYDPDTDGT